MMRIGQRLSDRMMNRTQNYPYCAQHWIGVSDRVRIWCAQNRMVNRVLYRVLYRVRQRVLEHALDSTR